MDTIFTNPGRKTGLNKGFMAALFIGALIIAAGIWLLSMRPSMDEQMAQILKDAHREGSPEFEEITKDIITSTDGKTVESPTVFGISMYINGKIRNKGNRVINGLEVKVWVVTRFNDVLKEKRVLVVPIQQPTLQPGETIPITLTLDGFSKDDDRANIRWKVTAIRIEK